MPFTPNPAPGAARRAVLVALAANPRTRAQLTAALAAQGIHPRAGDLLALLDALRGAGLIARGRQSWLGGYLYRITAAGEREIQTLKPLPPVPPEPGPVVPTPPAPPPIVPPPTVDPVEVQLLLLHNDRRRQVGAGLLVRDDRLQRAALLHAQDEAGRRRMGHDGSDGSDVATRVGRQEYFWRALGENVAYGQVDTVQVMGDWLGSPPHRTNIENPAYTQYGGAMARAADGTTYWTTIFASPMAVSRSVGEPEERAEPFTPDW